LNGESKSFLNIKVDRAERPDIDVVSMTGSGGWGSAPRFLQPMTIEFLLRRHVGDGQDALKAAIHILKAISRGGYSRFVMPLVRIEMSRLSELKPGSEALKAAAVLSIDSSTGSSWIERSRSCLVCRDHWSQDEPQSYGGHPCPRAS